MTTLIFSLLFSLHAQATDPQTLANALLDLLPEGHSKGADPQGAPCRVIFGFMPDVDPELVQYARLQVIPEAGRIVDLQFFFDGYGGLVTGSAQKGSVKLRYRSLMLEASSSAGGLLVTAKDRKGSASCSIVP